MNSYRDAPQKTSGLPSGIPYIIGNEAAERFSFYGMKTILAIFMTQFIPSDAFPLRPQMATMVYGSFID